jgi:1,2-beta-oligoglucan phosphorylase
MDRNPSTVSSLRLSAVADFQLHELTGANGLRAQLLPGGAFFALRQQETMINQLLPGPAEDGLFRLLVRWTDSHGAPTGWAPLTGPGLTFSCDDRAATWRTAPAGHTLTCTTTLALHPVKPGWAWRIRLRNTGTVIQRFDLLHAQDIGLADEGAVRNNEAYVSQYIDLLPVADAQFGPVILARQNQAMAGGRRPWLALACADGATSFCTDGWQFFGADHRFTGEPAAVRTSALPSRRLQYEYALAGLQSRALELAPGATAEVTFIARFLENHPTASGSDDLPFLHELLPLNWFPPAAAAGSLPTPPVSVFTSAPWLHGEEPSAVDWSTWFPGARRHEEIDSSGRVLSFFHGADTHVVSRDKEAAIARPHGHVIRSGVALWNDACQFGVTCYASGIFGAQSYLGNSSLARLLSVVRNHLNVARASGQRMFVRKNGSWHQLGVPSAFALQPGVVRWIYRLEDGTVEVRAWASGNRPASFLEVSVSAGPAREFLVTHQLALGSHEFEAAGELVVHEDGWLGCHPAADGFTAKHLPGTCFALAVTDSSHLAAHGGDELLYADGVARTGPYAAFLTKSVDHFALIMLGVTDGAPALPEAVAAARSEYAAQAGSEAHFPTASVQLKLGTDASVARINEVLPWFTHNAAIHFSAPHGLEQYGGAAWGVRDVCQGSVEWLLAAGEFAIVRRLLTTVFEQQYPSGHDATVAGGWPQWFMFPPFGFIQQAHSHGDVCFWPVKALCDYVEASNDFEFLSAPIGYTDAEAFTSTGPVESLWAHCDRVIAHCESRLVAGTALVNYGDGDWDDTLQPADPAMRTRMISSWTVGLAFHSFRQLADISRRAGEIRRAIRLDALLGRMRSDFAAHAMPGGIVAGFLISEPDGHFRPLLHPTDQVTGIRYRLLPMTRSMLAELFTPDEAARHAAIIEQHLRFTDGVRLMSEPAVYHGGLEKLFKRAETAANVGREIGLQYIHAHLRYAEAMAKLGDADRLWTALQLVNPVGLEKVLPTAAPRQSNVYFSSSDADFDDRYEAAARWSDLRAGKVAVRGGWRLYSSGPGLFLHKIRACLLGVRESFGDVVFDPVLPRHLNGLIAATTLMGRSVELVYWIKTGTSAPQAITVNGSRLTSVTRDKNPYRQGGLRVAGGELAGLLTSEVNRIEIEL